MKYFTFFVLPLHKPLMYVILNSTSQLRLATCLEATGGCWPLYWAVKLERLPV